MELASFSLDLSNPSNPSVILSFSHSLRQGGRNKEKNKGERLNQIMHKSDNFNPRSRALEFETEKSLGALATKSCNV